MGRINRARATPRITFGGRAWLSTAFGYGFHLAGPFLFQMSDAPPTDCHDSAHAIAGMTNPFEHAALGCHYSHQILCLVITLEDISSSHSR